uniref:PTM/DIR17-like Tudor domain-containing protein n=1 Tax=Pinguiococcus pyrenoidosus TaxID=172671 RepID=A0A7R9Y7B4_9STRA|mmetsp:Transcript_10125/g.38401  ORF Transcript_10125/g.38401 Transcript_10125/m.38401 type:complete len:1931 (+) Transcript_10125:188-5980(+)
MFVNPQVLDRLCQSAEDRGTAARLRRDAALTNAVLAGRNKENLVSARSTPFSALLESYRKKATSPEEETAAPQVEATSISANDWARTKLRQQRKTFRTMAALEEEKEQLAKERAELLQRSLARQRKAFQWEAELRERERMLEAADHQARMRHQRKASVDWEERALSNASRFSRSWRKASSDASKKKSERKIVSAVDHSAAVPVDLDLDAECAAQQALQAKSTMESLDFNRRSSEGAPRLALIAGESLSGTDAAEEDVVPYEHDQQRELPQEPQSQEPQPQEPQLQEEQDPDNESEPDKGDQRWAAGRDSKHGVFARMPSLLRKPKSGRKKSQSPATTPTASQTTGDETAQENTRDNGAKPVTPPSQASSRVAVAAPQDSHAAPVVQAETEATAVPQVVAKADEKREEAVPPAVQPLEKKQLSFSEKLALATRGTQPSKLNAPPSAEAPERDMQPPKEAAKAPAAAVAAANDRRSEVASSAASGDDSKVPPSVSMEYSSAVSPTRKTMNRQRRHSFSTRLQAIANMFEGNSGQAPAAAAPAAAAPAAAAPAVAAPVAAAAVASVPPRTPSPKRASLNDASTERRNHSRPAQSTTPQSTVSPRRRSFTGMSFEERLQMSMKGIPLSQVQGDSEEATDEGPVAGAEKKPATPAKQAEKAQSTPAASLRRRSFSAMSFQQRLELSMKGVPPSQVPDEPVVNESKDEPEKKEAAEPVAEQNSSGEAKKTAAKIVRKRSLEIPKFLSKSKEEEPAEDEGQKGSKEQAEAPAPRGKPMTFQERLELSVHGKAKAPEKTEVKDTPTEKKASSPTKRPTRPSTTAVMGGKKQALTFQERLKLSMEGKRGMAKTASTESEGKSQDQPPSQETPASQNNPASPLDSSKATSAATQSGSPRKLSFQERLQLSTRGVRLSSVPDAASAAPAETKSSSADQPVPSAEGSSGRDAEKKLAAASKPASDPPKKTGAQTATEKKAKKQSLSFQERLELSKKGVRMSSLPDAKEEAPAAADAVKSEQTNGKPPTKDAGAKAGVDRAASQLSAGDQAVAPSQPRKLSFQERLQLSTRGVRLSSVNDDATPVEQAPVGGGQNNQSNAAGPDSTKRSASNSHADDIDVGRMPPMASGQSQRRHSFAVRSKSRVQQMREALENGGKVDAVGDEPDDVDDKHDDNEESEERPPPAAFQSTASKARRESFSALSFQERLKLSTQGIKLSTLSQEAEEKDQKRKPVLSRKPPKPRGRSEVTKHQAQPVPVAVKPAQASAPSKASKGGKGSLSFQERLQLSMKGVPPSKASATATTEEATEPKPAKSANGEGSVAKASSKEREAMPPVSNLSFEDKLRLSVRGVRMSEVAKAGESLSSGEQSQGASQEFHEEPTSEAKEEDGPGSMGARRLSFSDKLKLSMQGIRPSQVGGAEAAQMQRSDDAKYSDLDGEHDDVEDDEGDEGDEGVDDVDDDDSYVDEEDDVAGLMDFGDDDDADRPPPAKQNGISPARDSVRSIHDRVALFGGGDTNFQRRRSIKLSDSKSFSGESASSAKDTDTASTSLDRKLQSSQGAPMKASEDHDSPKQDGDKEQSSHSRRFGSMGASEFEDKNAIQALIRSESSSEDLNADAGEGTAAEETAAEKTSEPEASSVGEGLTGRSASMKESATAPQTPTHARAQSHPVPKPAETPVEKGVNDDRMHSLAAYRAALGSSRKNRAQSVSAIEEEFAPQRESSASTPQDFHIGARIGLRVAAEFAGAGVHVGTITRYEEPFYEVVYDDGDREEIDEDEVDRAHDFYKSLGKVSLDFERTIRAGIDLNKIPSHSGVWHKFGAKKSQPRMLFAADEDDGTGRDALYLCWSKRGAPKIRTDHRIPVLGMKVVCGKEASESVKQYCAGDEQLLSRCFSLFPSQYSPHDSHAARASLDFECGDVEVRDYIVDQLQRLSRRTARENDVPEV